MKKRVDYLGLIWLHSLMHEFEVYCKKHKDLSIRRNARNFLLKNGYYNELKELRDCGFTCFCDDYDRVVQIAKTPWLQK